jgi:hypothetical protein
MNNLLQVGDIFSSSKLESMLHGDIARDNDFKYLFDKETNTPYVTFNQLHTENYEAQTSISWKEEKDGWYRDRHLLLSTKYKDTNLKGSKWKVTKAVLCGGGTGHGYHDVYPDGHYVEAVHVGGTQTVSFYQSGCFRGMVLPEDVTYEGKDKDSAGLAGICASPSRGNCAGR